MQEADEKARRKDGQVSCADGGEGDAVKDVAGEKGTRERGVQADEAAPVSGGAEGAEGAAAAAVVSAASHTAPPVATTRDASVFSKFLAYYAGETHLFVADLVCSVAIAGIDLAFPQILRGVSKGLFTQGPQAILSALWLYAAGLICLYVLRFGCKYFIGFWGHVMGARMESRMREDLFDAYERMSFAFFDKNKSGDLMSRLVSDLFDISEAAHHGPEFLLIGLVEVVGAFVILGTINVPLTCVLALITAALVAYNAWANVRMKAIFTENRVGISKVNSQVEDSLAGIRVVKGFAAEGTERSKFRSCNDAYLVSKTNMYRAMGTYQASISGMMGALNTLVLVYGGWLIAQGQMQAADLATYALYISMLTTPIENILNFTETFQKAIAGFKRFVEMVEAVPDVTDAPDARPIEVSEGHIVYEGVRFAYEGAEPVIRGLDLDIAPGETIALVGPSGGGKSTTCSLLPRFYDVAAGSISIDGQDVRSVTQKSLREAIGIVQQDVYLFDGTIADNIAYGRPGASAEDIREAARLANIDAFIQSLPEGYNTQVGERGARLSGGQKQRIAIARVFLKDPKILVLDEATSALDNESEHAVQESLARLSAGRTTLVIAHRLSTIRDADEIVTVDAGRVVERGTHEQLLALGGTYASYYKMQFGSSKE